MAATPGRVRQSKTRLEKLLGFDVPALGLKARFEIRNHATVTARIFHGIFWLQNAARQKFLDSKVYALRLALPRDISRIIRPADRRNIGNAAGVQKLCVVPKLVMKTHAM